MKNFTLLLFSLLFFIEVEAQTFLLELNPSVQHLIEGQKHYTGGGAVLRLNLREEFPELNEVIIFEAGYQAFWDKNSDFDRQHLFFDMTGNLKFLGSFYGVGGFRYYLEKKEPREALNGVWRDDFKFYLGGRFKIWKFELKSTVYASTIHTGWTHTITYRLPLHR